MKRMLPAHSTFNHADLPKIAASDIPDVLHQFNTKETGLTETEAKRRLDRYGENSLLEAKTKSPVIEFLNNFLDPLILTLIIISLISFGMGNQLNGIIIAVMVVMSVILNFIQEFKASSASKALRDGVAHTAVVWRNSRQVEILVQKLVPGDVIVVNAGDLIPADARVIEAKDFFVNQSTLTGESFPVEKTAGQAQEPADLTSMTNVVFSGTAVHTGCASAVVITTGKHTELGKLSSSLQEVEPEDEFSRAIHQFSRMMLKIIIILVTIIFGIKTLLYKDIWNSLQFAVAVAVGLTPEFLPMIMSVTMGQGSVRMAKKGVIVKKLTAIPTLGSMDVLCTDKTGTLTENKIAVVKYVDITNKLSLDTLKYAYLNSYFQSGITNPMDDAVREYGHTTAKGHEKVDEIPFDFERKKLTIITKNESEVELITKGAPESMLSSLKSCMMGTKALPMNKESVKQYFDLYHQLSAEGFRVLSVAVKKVSEKKRFTKADESNLTFVGFIAFLDPAKKGVRKALDELENLGVEVKVITGDNELVAQKICKDVDIQVKGLLLGSEINQLSDEALAKKAINTTIFARFDPEQKNRVIKALRSRDKVVGYMGDGINDAPSITTADVGISVANAVEVAREAADFVLTHKSLHELAGGVREGRKTFGNTMKYIMMGLSSNFGNMFSMLGAAIFLPFLPMLPIQILLNNFIYDFTQVAIPTDTVDEEYISKPKRLHLASIKKFMYIFGPISSLFDFATFGFLYVVYRHSPAQFQTGWFMESLATQTLVIHIIRTRLKPIIQSRASWPLFVTTIGGIGLAWTLPFTGIGKLFGFENLNFSVLAMLAGIVISYVLVVELVKQKYYQNTANI